MGMLLEGWEIESEDFRTVNEWPCCAHTDSFYIPYGTRLILEHISLRTYATYASNGAWVADFNADSFHPENNCDHNEHIPFSAVDSESGY